MIPIPVLRSKRIPALKSLAELGDCEILEQAQLVDVLERTWDSDAHFVTYFVPDEEEEDGVSAIPRFTKSILAELRKDGLDILTEYLVLDYDNPGHAEWTLDTLEDFWHQFENARNSDRQHAWLLSRYTAFYTTKHGARFIYRLERPVPVDEAEQRLLTLVQKFRSLGILVDEACKDWTRLFRLPKVERDGERTEDAEFFALEIQPDMAVNLAHVPPAAAPDQIAPRKAVYAEKPDPETAEATLWTTSGDGKQRKRTDWWNRAKTRLKNRECFPCIFEGEDLAPRGERNPTLLRYAGQLVSLLYNLQGTTIEKCYALLLPAAMQLEGDDGGRSWGDSLWHHIKHAWGCEEGKVEQREKEKVREAAVQMTEQERIAEGAREWARPFLDEEILGDNAGLWDWLSERMILNKGNSFWVLGPNGYYHPQPVRKDMLPAHIRRIGMDEHLDFWVYTDDGESRQSRAAAKLLEEHGSSVASINGRANIPGGVLELDATGKSHLSIPVFSIRPDLEPVWNDDIDFWLRMFFGREEHYRKGCHWIGMALLDFDTPICALSLVGPPGAGKKLLMQGLAECITTRKYAGGEDMVGDYQANIAETPFVNINEGFERSLNRDPADTFRRWTSGDPITVNPKFEVPIRMRSPLRLVITANNDDVIRSVTAGRNLSLEDRDAIGIRIMHIRQPDNAATLLEAKGGRQWTDGWIDGDGGKRGNEIVAKHFMWLREAAKYQPRGKRFLVEGDLSQGIIQDMTLESGIAPEVVETLVAMIQEKGRYQGFLGIATQETPGCLYVTPDAVVKFWNKKLADNHKARKGGAINVRTVAVVLRSLARTGWETGRYSIKDDATGRPRRARWYLIDLRLLQRAAESAGYPHDALLTHLEKAA